MNAVIRRATPERMGPADSKRNVYVYDAAVGTQLDDLNIPAFWQKLSMQVPPIRPFDHIEVREEMGAFWIQGIVTHVSHEGLEIKWVKGAQLESVGAHGAASRLEGTLSVRFLGTHRQWGVLRGEDVLKDGMKSQAEASLWLTQHAKTTESKS